MTKEKSLTWKLALAVTVILAVLVTAFICKPSTAKAADTAPEESEDSGETGAQEEKTLLQCSNDWIIFNYLDETSKPMFDIRYLDKTIEELEADNLLLQYRTIYQCDEDFELSTSSWYDSDAVVSEETKTDIENHKANYFIQFRIVNAEDKNTTVSKSDMCLIWPQEEPFPYIVSSSIDPGEIYDTRTQPTELTVNFKFNDFLESVDMLGSKLSTSIPMYKFKGTVYTKNYSSKRIYENQVIDGKEYSLYYTEISIDIGIPSYHRVDTNDDLVFNFLYTISGFEGVYTHKNPTGFMFKINIPSYRTETTSPDNILVDAINISGPSSTVAPGNTIALTAAVLPEDATDKSLTWSSSNPDYATVDGQGTVTAKAAGAGKTVTITAVANDGSGVEGYYTLTILESEKDKNILVTGITVSAPSNKVKPGNTVRLTANVVPANATNKAVAWSSSNSAYAAVDTNGIVTAKAAGAGKTVTITAKAKDGSGTTATFTLSIQKISVSKIKLSADTKTVQAGKKVTVKAAVTPSNATNKNVAWSSSNKKYATVSSKGVVTTKKAGIGKTVTITAKAKDGSGKKASIKIKIVKTVKVSSIKLSANSKTVKAGKKVTVKAAVKPGNATNKAVTWASSNKKYASVNKKGVVTAKKAGKGKTVTITAKAKDGSGKKAAIKIKIK